MDLWQRGLGEGGVIIAAESNIQMYELHQVYGPLKDGEIFMPDDFSLLEKLVSVQSGRQLKDQVQGIGITANRSAALAINAF